MTPTTGLSSVANTHKECPHQVESGDFIELELDFDFEFESSERARARVLILTQKQNEIGLVRPVSFCFCAQIHPLSSSGPIGAEIEKGESRQHRAVLRNIK